MEITCDSYYHGHCWLLLATMTGKQTESLVEAETPRTALELLQSV